MKKFIAILLLAVIGYFLVDIFFSVPFGEDSMVVAKDYLEKGPKDLQVANTITAIIVNFRGFDTLGEVTVLFLASLGLGSILFRRRKVHTNLNPKRETPEASSIVQIGGKILFPFIILLGAYVFIHGHLTPGGGIQGGVIIATGYLMIVVALSQISLVSHSFFNLG